MIVKRKLTYVSMALSIGALGLSASCRSSTDLADSKGVAELEQRVTAPFLTPSRDRMAVFDSGGWALDLNGNGVWDGCGVDRCLTFGGAGDQPIVGNWKGPGGFQTVGVYRPSDKSFYIDFNGNGSWDGCSVDRCYTNFMTGQTGDRGVAGVWSGTRAGVGIFRNGQWFVDRNANGVHDGCGTDGCWTFGASGDVPVAGDWNGGGLVDIGVFRNGEWFLDGNGDRTWDNCAADDCGVFGQTGDLPFSFRPNGASAHEVGTFRAGAWFLDANGNQGWDGCVTDDCITAGLFGGAGQVPVAGEWPQIQWGNYGDAEFSAGLNKTSVFTSMWENSATVVAPGTDNDCPAGRAFIGIGQVGSTGVGLLQADLNCIGTTGCAQDVYASRLRPQLENVPGLSALDPEISADNQLVRLSNGDLIYVRQARRRHNPSGQTGTKLRDAFVDTGAYIVWRSSDCGNTWQILPAVRADSSAILGGVCGLRQRESTVAVYRPSENKFFIDSDANYAWDSSKDRAVTFSGMVSTDIPVVGDWNSSQGSTVGYFRNGTWRVDFNGDYDFTDCSVDLCATFGQAGDVPVVGRWTNPGTSVYKPDLRSQLGVFRNGEWILDTNSNGAWDPGVDQAFMFGAAGDRPVVGQWGNTGLASARTRVGVFRPSTNEWFLDAGADGWQGCGTDICFSTFGGSPQVPVSGIWSPSPDYQERVAVFENGTWHRDLNGNRLYDGVGETAGPFGGAGDIPLVGNFVSSFGGFDRVEAYADPSNGMLYMTSLCAYRNIFDTVLFSSRDSGNTWKVVKVSGGGFVPLLMTSVSGSNKLYLFNPSSPDPRLWPANVNTTTNTVTVLPNWFVYQQHAPTQTLPNSSTWPDRSLSLPSVLAGRAWDGSAGITRVGRSGSVDSVRIFYPSLERRGGTGVDTQVMRVAQLDITTTSSAVTNMTRAADLGTISATANVGSVTQATVVEGPPGIPIDLVYWKETDGSAPGALGSVRTRGRLFKALNNATFDLSQNATGQQRTWDTYALTGDYQKGASYASGNVAVFLTQWVETPSTGGRTLHSHIIDARNP